MSILLPRLISNGMVLQRDAKVKLWGKADAPVIVAFLGNQYHADLHMDGSWSVELNDLPPGGPYTLSINEITLHDVYVGDVWLCSGQSNMQLPMQRIKHMYPEEMTAPLPFIRQFSMPQRVSFHGPEAELEDGGWAGATPSTIGAFSGVGYFFAKRLYEKYQVPIGLILCAIGGTPIHAWMGREAMQAFPELLAQADTCADDGFVAAVQAEDARRAKAFFDEIDATDPGLSQQWYSPDFDDSRWEERPLLEPWQGTGSFWLRKTLEIPQEMDGMPATLFLGTITDWDIAYVNGHVVGNTTYRYPPREYNIPALKKGRCVIALRVIAKDGGGFIPGKQYLLSTQAGSFNLNGLWRFRHGGTSTPYQPETFFHYKPTALYNGMLAPLSKYTIQGAIWYQGESDTANPNRYAEKFEAMVHSWRNDWGYDFPFIFSELAHWSGGRDWHTLRNEQWQCLRVPNTAMAAAFDLGEESDLHPLNKQTVGDRLARCAMRVAYHEKLPISPFEVIGIR